MNKASMNKFFDPSFSWGLTFHCFLLGNFIFPLCLQIFLITWWMVLWQYLITDLAIIILGWLLLPTLFITFCSYFSKYPVLLWKYTSNIHIFCFHNVLLLIIEEEIFSSYFLFGHSNPNHLSNSLLLCIYNKYEPKKVFQIPTFKW